ncbi:extracellular solute-binding protein [Alphaproteobacteria bacterium]|nr:extracellular solute-binding protein [Alphaproteobacteria bacterium]
MKKFLLLFFCLILAYPSFGQEEKVLYLYYWSGSISDASIQEFEEETGIKVKKDFYDSEEVLEAKLLAGSSLYDVVMPSATPYYGRQVQLDLYLPLDRTKLFNWKNIDPSILQILKKIDPDNIYGVPYTWGTTGFIYKPEELKKILPNTPLDTYKIIFDPKIIQKLSVCKVGLLDQPQDLFEAYLRYSGLTSNHKDSSQIEIFKKTLEKVRPYIKSFTSNSGKMTNDILTGEACLIQMWSGEALRAQLLAQEMGRKISFVVPKEHAGVWCDLLCIPKKAPHPENAHKFLDFMMRPDIAAKNTESTLMATTILSARKKLPPSLRRNSVLFPKKEILKNLKLSEVLPLKYERKLNRTWAHIKAEQ